jgi:signal transduction histidine kinase
VPRLRALARLLRTSSFRLTLVYAGVFAAAALVLFSVVYAATAGYMARELDRTIAAEVSLLQEAAKLGGVRRLATIIGERQAATPLSGTVYLLQDQAGERLAGTLRPRRPAYGWFDLQGRSRSAEGDPPHRIRARGVRLDDGGYLVVGQDANQLDEVQGLIVRAFGWSAAAMLLLALGGGMLASAAVLRRVGTIARASQAIAQGDLGKRIASRGVGDEFDQLAEALNAMVARIAGLMEGLQQVSNDIAHDLRTPLSRLRQRLEAARRAEPGLAGYEALVERAIADVDAILETFAAILRIAEIEAAPRTTGFAEIDLSELLSTVVEVYEPAAAERGQTLDFRIAPELAVRGDRELLTQLVANLVQNAIAHTPPGTRITVAGAVVDGAVEATVADTGPGIPAEERGKVLRRFYRLEASRGTPGSGLGLSLAAAIAALHGATLTLADNAPGLRVVLRFPTPV